MSIANKLDFNKVILGGFALTLIVVALAGLFVRSSVQRLEQAHVDSEELNELRQDLLFVREEVTTQRALQAEAALLGDPGLVDEFEASAELALARLDTAAGRPAAEDLDLSSTIARIMEIDNRHDSTFAGALIPAIANSDREAIAETAAVLQAISLDFKAEIDPTLSQVEEISGEIAAESESARNSVNRALVVLISASVVAVLALGMTTTLLLRRRFSDEIGALDEASVELRRAGDELVEQSDATREELLFVASSSESAAGNIGQLTSSIDDMTCAIRNIANSSAEVSAVASDAVDWTRVTNETVAKLGDSSAEIGEVVEVITSIAEQTNLLALNATIEAARAGEAGKGFAVVANEVKELAKQTSAATDRISARIAAIQTDTADSVKAIDRISEVIQKISELQQSVSAAVEEQHITTGEIGSIVALVVDEVESLAERVKDASGVAELAAQTADGTRRRSETVADVAASIRGFVGIKDLETASRNASPSTLESTQP